MKSYYILYYRDFANTYNLCYCTTPEECKAAEAAGYERISRADAIRKCINENSARKHDPNFSGYGSNTILPWEYIKRREDYEICYPEEIGLTLNGYIWE